MKETLGDKLGRGVGWLLGKGARAGVDAVARFCGARADSGLVNGLKEIAETAGQATGRTAGRLFDLGLGLATTVKGVVNRDGDTIKEGLSAAGSAVGKMAGAALAGTVMLGAKTVESVASAGRAAGALAEGKEEEAKQHWEKAKEGLVWTGKAFVASVIAIGPFEAAGIIDLVPGDETPVSDTVDTGDGGAGITGTGGLPDGTIGGPGYESAWQGVAGATLPGAGDNMTGSGEPVVIPYQEYGSKAGLYANFNSDPGTISDIHTAGNAGTVYFDGYGGPAAGEVTGSAEHAGYTRLIGGEEFNSEPFTAGQAGLLPDLPAAAYDADDDGFADPGTVDELVQAGYVDDAHYVPDPPRDPAVRDEFLRQHGLTDVPPGYEVHHIVPLYAGGADSPDNMILVKTEDHVAIHHELDRMYREEKGFPVK